MSAHQVPVELAGLDDAGKITLQVSDRPESYGKTLLITVSQFWGQPFQNAQRFEKGPQNKMNNYPMNSVSCESQVVVILRDLTR